MNNLDTILKLIPLNYAEKMGIVPLKIDDKKLIIGVLEKTTKIENEIEFITGLKVIVKEIDQESMNKHLLNIYETAINEEHSSDIEKKIISNTTIEFVDKIIKGAIQIYASDIHFETLENKMRIRYRIDGYLNEIGVLEKEKAAAISSRIKIISNLDIAEKRRPQDGKIRFKYEDRFIDIRVSIIPTIFGEKCVLRILDKSNVNLDINSLGFEENQLRIFKKYINLPYGMILVTGPTGSGKTTTLYSALKTIHSKEKNILTIEDPIEYNIDGINQCNVKADIGFNFSNALRAFLRQDPDVIMVGEIRDRETADIAIRASLTGHLVFSTLHTNDSISAVNRLIDMGIEPFLVSSAVKLIVAQRLVRKLCKCKIESQKLAIGSFTTSGCSECNYLGYKGRTPIFELFEITKDIAELISEKSNYELLKERAEINSFKTLFEVGQNKIKDGITTYEEIQKETIFN
ncbi:MAG: GspE/PulE family protein [Melioribacteraceae bacterium]|jgi:type IV pilus assembly protein PilB|nr:GspE/PulE family protein [Melioribacteraceae bacterium]